MFRSYLPQFALRSAPGFAAMDSVLDSLRAHASHLAQVDGAGLIGAVVLIGVLAALTRHPWRHARGSVVLVVLHLVAAGARELVGPDTALSRPIELLGLFFLLSAYGRTLFVLFTQSRPVRPLVNLPKIFLDIIHVLVFIAALLLTLHVAGVDPSSLVTGSAVITVVLGLSLRDTLGNLFSGLAIQAQRPFEVGDWIQFDQVPSHIGQVVEINWRATKVVTLDAVEIVIPNATLGQGYIVNYTKPRKFSRRSVYVNAANDVPPQRVQQIILESLQGAWGVLTDPPPSVVTNAFDERGVQYWVRFFTVEFDKRDKVDGGARDRIWYALARHGVAIPAPQREVRVEDAPEGAERAAQDQEAQRMKALRCVDFFTPMGEEALGRLAATSRTGLYAEGEVVIRQGAPGDELFVIQRGEVAVTLDRGGSPLEVARLQPGSFFGEMSLLTGEPRTATVRASKECELLVVDKAGFGRVLEAFPELAERVSEVIAGRQAGLTSKMGEAAGTDAPDRDDRRGWLLQRIREFFNV